MSGTAGLSPMTYSARVDVCEVGTETGPLGCAANPTNPVTCSSCSGPATALPMTFTAWPNPGVPGANGLPVPGLSGTINSESGNYCSPANPITQPSNNQYLCGINTMISDPDFHTQMTRATDYSMANAQGRGFNMGSAGTYKYWASDSSKLFVGNMGGGYALLAFNPSQWGQTPGPVTPSPIYGASIYGVPSFSGTNPHVFYTLNTDQENTVIGSLTSGSCLTPETIQQTSTGASAMLRAVNPSVLMQIGAVTGTADNSHPWTGQTSGCVFTPNSSYSAPPTGSDPTSGAPYANTLYAATINDATQSNPALWTASYSLVFSFNYAAGMVGSPAAAYFPASATSCLPANYNGQWAGVFQGSLDDTSFGVPLSDNGQVTSWGQSQSSCSTSPGGVCTGPVYYATYIRGHGCRVYNTHTNQITDDNCSTQYPCGQVLDGQKNYITGTMTGTPTMPVSPGGTGGTPGALLTQDVTGATTEYKCTGTLLTNQSPPSGAYRFNQFACGVGSATAWEVGVIYGTPDGTHTWRDGSGNSIAPSALPQPVPFYYPLPQHDANQNDNAAYASVAQTCGGNGRVLSEQGGVPSAGYTTITVTKSGSDSSPGSLTENQDEQKRFYNLTGSAAYLNCTDANQCPVWTITQGGVHVSTFVIADSIGGSYTNNETTASCSMSNPTNPCPLYTANGTGYNANYSVVSTPNYWHIPSLVNSTCSSYGCEGHAAHGSIGDARGTQYWWYNVGQPSTPCLVSGYSPCPSGDIIPLLSSPLPEDDHGTYNSHGAQDLSPFLSATTHVCGLAGSGAGSNSCYSPYGKAWESEIIGVENSVTNNASGQCGSSLGPGCHCNYGTGPTACTYRLGHTFNSDDVWDFNAQNNIGNVSSDGQWVAFPSTWMDTLGCTNGATTCWGSYVASGPPSATTAGATVQTNASGVVTVTMPNTFCAPGGNQYYWSGSAVQTVACGALAEQVTLSGFAEAWANHTITLTAVGGCDSTDANAGNCTSFSGTAPGIPNNYGPVTETGTQTAAPVNCLAGSGANTYCQRADIWIAKLGSAY